MMPPSVDRHVIEFLGTLDIGGDAPNRPSEADLDRAAFAEFANPGEILQLAGRVQALKSENLTDDPLIIEITELIRHDPRYFLVLMHLHRQIRFTNIELVRLLFDPVRLDEVDYYRSLADKDPTFREISEKIRKRPDWPRPSRPTSAETFDLAVGKRAIYSYLETGQKAWIAWRSRIDHDPGVARRVAQFVVNVEDLGSLIRENAVVDALRRSLRTRNVEQVKASRGKFGASRVRELLDREGFIRVTHGDRYPTLSEISSLTRVSLDSGPFYASEVKGTKGAAERKRFDFALANKNGASFVVETTYYSTSMSKVGEVVKDFRQLRESLADSYHLFFITDGIGWFGRVKDVSQMLKENEPEDGAPGAGLPFLLNLYQFGRLLPRIKLELASSP